MTALVLNDPNGGDVSFQLDMHETKFSVWQKMRLGHQHMKKKYYYVLSIASLWLFNCFLAAEGRAQQQQHVYIKTVNRKKQGNGFL